MIDTLHTPSTSAHLSFPSEGRKEPNTGCVTRYLVQVEQGSQYGVSRSFNSNGPSDPKLPSGLFSSSSYPPVRTPSSSNSEKYSLPSAAFQYLNSIKSLGLPRIPKEKPRSTVKETPRTIPSTAPMAATWSQVFPSGPTGVLSTG